MKVLVVDDDPTVLELLQNLLEMEGYQVTKAASGREALECLREKQFDMAVLDVALPDLNGFLLFNEIQKKHPRLARKVLFLSGLPFSGKAILRMSSFGAAFLNKPVKTETLIGTLREIAGASMDAEPQPDSSSSDG